MFHEKALNRTINVCLVKIVSQKNQIKTATFFTVKSFNKTNAIPFVYEQIIFTKNASKRINIHPKMICTPKVRHFWRCIFLWQRKVKFKTDTRQNSRCVLY